MQPNITPLQWERTFAILREAGVEKAWRHEDGDPTSVVIVVEKHAFDGNPILRDGDSRQRLTQEIVNVIPLKVWITYARPSPLPLTTLF